MCSFSVYFRILLDRAQTDLDSDPELVSPLPNSPLHNSSTSETNTSNPASRPTTSPLPPSSKTPVDLSQIFLNIKACRWRHFRPRTLSHHHPRGSGNLCRSGFRDLSRTVSGLTRSLSGGAQNRTSSGQVQVNGECFFNILLCIAF